MKTVAVTGASGFIGRHVLAALASRPVDVVAISRRAEGFASSPRIRRKQLDIAQACDDPFEAMARPDILIHLAWDGLPNYRSLHHFETELPRHYDFLKYAVQGGLKSIFCAGTCFEYGMQSGVLSEETPCLPSNPYGFSKHALQQQLALLRETTPFALTWARLFYTYGPGQHPKSLWPQFQDAHRRGASVFDMSGGAQLRDFLDIGTLGALIVSLALDHPDEGVVNLCSGQPIAVCDIVARWAADLNWDVRLNLGHYPYADYEPMEFWGDDSKLQRILGTDAKRNLLRAGTVA
ncbi:dTDP-6-deoxy-L-talose 4-dehydrogenase (NAD+) [Pararhizobium capsulatum DSM 1112]|uniref:dTDP-6-deoxy-L-talose 4-dehydrogenase (NAD+) n=1 Tax=Pararhizobium capsulatum DSM 1112 TaxID=1121113 RepID=A0ABU0BKX9_9HYPH|nr:NAD(P)-dependent oxidoreductase [Pararhizobium capsulatum]MDQ0318903.1 dTDP-6-deoxy-L-talose 4-dehydrogenase (NAD+) [Pararhizobium capsulatum DSM 1112]